jgi:hypothetical protein
MTIWYTIWTIERVESVRRSGWCCHRNDPQATTRRAALPAGDYGVAWEEEIVAVVKRKSLDDLARRFVDGSLTYALAELAHCRSGRASGRGPILDAIQTRACFHQFRARALLVLGCQRRSHEGTLMIGPVTSPRCGPHPVVPSWFGTFASACGWDGGVRPADARVACGAEQEERTWG